MNRKLNSRTLGGGYRCESCAETYPNGEEFRTCPIHGDATAWNPLATPTLSEEKAQRRRIPEIAEAYAEFEMFYQRSRGMHPSVEAMPRREDLVVSAD